MFNPWCRSPSFCQANQFQGGGPLAWPGRGGRPGAVAVGTGAGHGLGWNGSWKGDRGQERDAAPTGERLGAFGIYRWIEQWRPNSPGTHRFAGRLEGRLGGSLIGRWPRAHAQPLGAPLLLDADLPSLVPPILGPVPLPCSLVLFLGPVPGRWGPSAAGDRSASRGMTRGDLAAYPPPPATPGRRLGPALTGPSRQ